MIARFDIPSERGDPAQFDRRHDAALGGRQRRIMLLDRGIEAEALDRLQGHFYGEVGIIDETRAVQPSSAA
ncbi:hypothetical protein NKI38_29510 [Mesorhizobium sp. M0621]|uniref:hypothetical protein n=1 Tax=Mesorhizobium sp. M0621 TaxID=2956974 RepID=UPI00333AF3EB